MYSFNFLYKGVVKEVLPIIKARRIQRSVLRKSWFLGKQKAQSAKCFCSFRFRVEVGELRFIIIFTSFKNHYLQKFNIDKRFYK